MTLVLGVGACAGDTGALPDLDTSNLPPCASQPAAPSLDPVPGLVLPDQATAFSAYAVGPLTQVEGVLAMTPVQAREFYEAQPGLEVLSVEDERVEAEVLVTDGTHRMFVKVQIVCDGGSSFTATVGAEDDPDALPTPAGAPGSR